MSSNIYRFTGTTKHILPPEQILESAKGKLTEVVVLGWDHNLELYVAASDPDLARAIYLAECFKHKAVGGEYDYEPPK